MTLQPVAVALSPRVVRALAGLTTHLLRRTTCLLMLKILPVDGDKLCELRSLRRAVWRRPWNALQIL
jgi:hypothetical protein